MTMRWDKCREIAFEQYKLKKICEKCWNNKNIIVHHIDKNHFNNKKNNIQILCRSCHTRLHMKWFKHSKESRLKMSKSKQWKRQPLYEETKKKISNAHKWKKLSKEHKKNISIAWKWRVSPMKWIKMQNNHLSKKINQYDMSLKFIKTRCSITEAALELNLHHSNISRCCRHISKQTWWYKREYFNTKT